MAVTVVRAADLAPRPWRNGGGTTTEIAVSPGAPFAWRASTATVASDGPFSDFSGYDRFLVLLSGPGFDLRFADRVVRVDQPLQIVRFDGGDPCTASLLGAASVDWNWMVARDRLAGALAIASGGRFDALVACAVAPAVVRVEGTERALGAGDVLVAPDRFRATLASGGPMIVADAVPR
jgi:uncharacterized protein